MKNIKSLLAVAFIVFVIGLTSCTVGPQKIRIGKDVCSFCKMSVVDNRFGAEIVTKKGKVFIFDDTHCLIAFKEANTIDTNDIKNTYFTDFNTPHDLLVSDQALLMKSIQLRSPMGGNVAAFSTQDELRAASAKLSGEQVTLEGMAR